MKRLRRILIYLKSSFLILFISCHPIPKKYDVVIYGGTSAGVAAAVQVARMGKSVLLLEPGGTLGGLTTGGLGATDIGNKQAIGGISREFYERIAQKYADSNAWKYQKRGDYIKKETQTGRPSMWTFEPKKASEVFQDMVREWPITIIYHERLDLGKKVEKENGVLTGIIMESGKEYHGKMFIDATYEGDLMAQSGVSYTVGRESNQQYGETLNGVQKARAKYHQFPDGVDPYLIKGDPSSGLLPNVNQEIKNDGTADKMIQAYCFRMCLTDVSKNRIAIQKPTNYKEQAYELLFRAIEAGYKGPFFTLTKMPNRKTDSNNKGPFSTDYIGHNYDYADGDYETRKKIILAHETYQKGLLWTLANHPRIPLSIREEYAKWGLPKDEFQKNGHWPSQLYVREARRMVGDFVMTEQYCTQDSISADESIGMGAYTMDSHHMQRFVDKKGFVKNEGDVEVGGFGPYPISYKAILPKEKECTNLLVPVCLSASHIAYGSIRMEPVFMILGQSAATAACLAIDGNVPVQEVSYKKLEKQLEKDGQVLKNQSTLD